MRLAGLLMLVAAFAGVAGGCGRAGSSAGPVPTTPAGQIDYTKLRGYVRADGSSTVFPITEAVAEEFARVANRVRANVAFSGTGGGFEKFCRGEIDIANASRPMTAAEKESCAARGIAPEDIIELQVAIDALTIVVSPRNTWATCLTPAQVREIFRKDGAAKWSDIDPSWPDARIAHYYPGADSGTFDYFTEAVHLRGADRSEPPHRADGTASEDDNILVRGVEGDRNGIGYFGFAVYQEAGRNLKALQIDGGDGCIAPSLESAIAGDYEPLSRPLLVYARASRVAKEPAILAFLAFYLEHMNALSREVGYIPLPAGLAAAQLDKIAAFLPRQSALPGDPGIHDDPAPRDRARLQQSRSAWQPATP